MMEKQQASASNGFGYYAAKISELLAETITLLNLEDMTVDDIDENDALKLISPDYISRKGSVITVTIGSGTFKYPSNSLILLNAGAKKANYALPIIIVVLTLVIAAGAVAFIVLKNKKNDEHMHDTSI